MTKIKNPTQDKLKIMYKGVWYEVEPEGELKNVPKEAAEYWKSMIHNFIILEDEQNKSMEEEKVEEVIEEEKEEEAKEAEEEEKEEEEQEEEEAK